MLAGRRKGNAKNHGEAAPPRGPLRSFRGGAGVADFASGGNGLVSPNFPAPRSPATATQLRGQSQRRPQERCDGQAAEETGGRLWRGVSPYFGGA